MEIETIVKLIEQLGVPIVVLGFCGWYIKFLQIGFTRERSDLRDSFAQERGEWLLNERTADERLVELMKASSEALINMKTALAEQTAAMRELLGKLDRKR